MIMLTSFYNDNHEMKLLIAKGCEFKCVKEKLNGCDLIIIRVLLLAAIKLVSLMYETEKISVIYQNNFLKNTFRFFFVPGYAVISDQRTNKKGDTVSCWNDAHKAKEKSKSASQSTDKQQKEERPKAKSMSDLMKKPTLKKLFSYVLPDWPLMVVGFIFLVGASVSEIFLPLFTGKVITGDWLSFMNVI